MTVQEIWNDALVNIESVMGELNFKTWILPLEPYSIDGDNFVLVTQSDFSRNYLTNYKLLLKNAISDAAAKDLSPLFKLKNEIREYEEKGRTFMPKNNTYMDSQLLDKYVFSNFITGSSNQFARAAAEAVVDNPGTTYNPLFFYGESGIGKTHLMHAIGNAIAEEFPDKKILYVQSETFTNEMISAIKTAKSKEFREKYRNLDVLLIDDIQFITGKEGTQEEFFYTFEKLYSANKQIVITSDVPPEKMSRLEERLKTRFQQGLMADMQTPDYETRVAILEQNSLKSEYNISKDVIEFIAKNISSNVRNLQGALNKTVAHARVFGDDITIDLAKKALKDMIDENNVNDITIPSIIDTVARYYNITTKDIISPTRKSNIAFPRQIAMYICRIKTSYSLPVIGKYFADRDHTTVLYAVDKVAEKIKTDKEVENNVNELLDKLSY
ncbi:MAG: chromosomal replication initiator protein DnaA [Clostridia bacterium]|jgi:chromosomal replication initiator protein|nr:chromosomal replication initiator protein DnaA [Clostridia bacterium]MDD4542433.1 chromosomal replication initiator protein DnaA [Clostridia bacterium]HPJ76118.1 chromosomal replication initiator protein DnaA [Clostridia bacterium]HXK71211.1 chromosomal replication initiator protein DnaA [Clostridia bacterium]